MHIAINCTGAHRGLRGRCILQHGTAAWNGSVESVWNGSVERQRGTAAWSAPSCCAAAFGTLHAAVPCCRMQRGLTSALAAWNGRVECAKLLRSSFWHTPRCRSMLQNAAGSDLSTGSVERPRGVRHWRTPRCRSTLQNAAGSDLSTAGDGGTTRGGRPRPRPSPGEIRRPPCGRTMLPEEPSAVNKLMCKAY